MSTPTPRTDAAAGAPSHDWEATASRIFDESQKLERELDRERAKVRVLRGACGMIERKAGEDYDERDPLSDVGCIATAALAATEGKS